MTENGKPDQAQIDDFKRPGVLTENFTEIYKHSSDAVLLLDEQGVILAASEKTRRITMQDPAELQGKDFFTLLSPETLIPLKSAYSLFCKGEKQSFKQVLKLVSLNGTLFYLQAVFQYQLRNAAIAGNIVHLRMPPVKLAKSLQPEKQNTYRRKNEDGKARPEMVQAYFDTEEKYRRLVEYSIMGIGLSRGKEIVYANNRLLEIFGYESFDEFAVKSLYEYVAAESREYVKEQRIKLFELDNQAVEFECKIIRKDGEKRDIAICAAKLVVHGDEYLQSTFRDITESKLAHKLLKESEQRFNLIFKKNPAAFIISTFPAGKIVEINEAALALSGLRREEVLGKNMYEAGVSFDKRRWKGIDEERQSDGTVSSRELTVKRKDGSRIWVLFNSELIELNNEKHYLSVVIDITPRKLMEQQLREKEQAYRNLYENSFSGIYRSTLSGTLLMANKVLPTLLGYESVDEIKKRRTKDYYVDPDEHTDFIKELTLYGEVQNFELRLRRKDGTIGWFRESARAVFNSDREIEYIEGILEDISSTKLYEEKLSSLNEELERRVVERTAELNVLTSRAPIPIGFFDASRRLLEANPSWRLYAEQWNCDAELSGLLEYIVEIGAVKKNAIEKLYNTGGEIRLEPLLLPASNEQDEESHGRTVVITLYTLENSAGKIDRLACLIEDITEDLRAAKTQRELKLHKYYSALILETLEEERKRLARELHDVIGHNLVLLKLKLEIYQKSNSLNDGEFSELLEMISCATREIGTLSKNLRPEVLDNYGLQRSLQMLTEEMEQLYGVSFSLAVDSKTEEHDEHIKLNLYRIVQEAVSNIGRHADATSAEIRISTNNGSIAGCIEDNGRGMNGSNNATGRGRLHMRERAKMLGGDLKIQSRREAGTKISFTIPLRTSRKS